MSDNERTHEQMTETRSWTDSDGTDHTTTRPICDTCYREQTDRYGYLEFVSADYPCDVVRLRERVAAYGETLERIRREFTDASRCANCGSSVEDCCCVVGWVRAALAVQEQANWGPAVMEHRIARTVLENMAGQEATS